jgi:hypothetical protein
MLSLESSLSPCGCFPLSREEIACGLDIDELLAELHIHEIIQLSIRQIISNCHHHISNSALLN